jgi:hypothetical protein
MIKNIYLFSCKAPVILVRFQQNMIFLDIFSKSTQISILEKIHPVGADLLHEDRRTDMTKLTVVLRNFAKVPKMIKMSTIKFSCPTWKFIPLFQNDKAAY